MEKIFYKENNTVKLFTTSGTLSIDECLEIFGNPSVYVVLPYDNTQFDQFSWCLKIENGVLSYDLALLKEAVHQARKNILKARFKPYDAVFEDIYAKKIPEDFFDGGYAVAEAKAETERMRIRADLENYKQAINNATTAEEVLAIYENIINTN